MKSILKFVMAIAMANSPILFSMGAASAAAPKCDKNQVYSASMQQCIPKSLMCSNDQVYSSSMSKCIPKAAMCSSNQVYSSSMGQCIPKNN